MQIVRSNSDSMSIDKLPDGSKIVVDSASQTVFAMNATAGAAWDACSTQSTLQGVVESMQHSFDPGTTEELAQEAILQLENHKLVKTSDLSSHANRRQFVSGLGAVTLPLVVSLTMVEQRAFAEKARSFDPGKGNHDHHHHGPTSS